MSKTKRIFIAIDLPSLLKEEIKQKCLYLCWRYFPLEKGLIRWTRPENLHLTLKFLGNVPITEIGKVENTLKEKLAFIQPFTLLIKGFGFFSQKKKPRVIWLGVFDSREQLKKLVTKFNRDEYLCRFHREKDKEFISHLTLGRVKKRLSKIDYQNLLKIKQELNDRTLGKFKVDSIKIMESKTLPDGPRYSVIKSFSL